jgi:protein-L-isoaspartate(D-aspartate) O-methyltransferase
MMMTIDLAQQRQFFAEEVTAVAAIQTAGLVDALASVPRERFLNAGPWFVRSEADLMAGPRQTPDADPRHVYHNYAIAIDPARQLFNGVPGLVVSWIDRLELKPGARVLHVGTGTGYYTGLIGHTVGASGAVVGIEVDEQLAAHARESLAPYPWIDVRTADAKGPFADQFDAILINAGVTHAQDSWLDALAPGGHMIVPFTASLPAMGPIGKGVAVRITKADAAFPARVIGFTAIFSGVGLRDETLNQALGGALMKSPFPPIKRLRRDPHEPSATCWLHGPSTCLSLE